MQRRPLVWGFGQVAVLEEIEGERGSGDRFIGIKWAAGMLVSLGPAGRLNKRK